VVSDFAADFADARVTKSIRLPILMLFSTLSEINLRTQPTEQPMNSDASSIV
jgi:hypothetical protein